LEENRDRFIITAQIFVEKFYSNNHDVKSTSEVASVIFMLPLDKFRTDIVWMQCNQINLYAKIVCKNRMRKSHSCERNMVWFLLDKYK